MKNKIFTAILLSLLLTSCGQTEKKDTSVSETENNIIAATPLVADVIESISGYKVRSIIPNGLDSHTYMPSAKELSIIDKAEYVFLADINLNTSLSGIIKLTKSKKQIIDLNKESLDKNSFIKSGNDTNPHTWTSLKNVSKWADYIYNFYIKIDKINAIKYKKNYELFIDELNQLDSKISSEKIITNKKIMVYHDAWLYFAKDYNINIIGAIQARNFTEPTAKELAKIIEQIKKENVKSFYGSEVYPSDILEVIENETGAKYISELSDDKLPEETKYLSNSKYLQLMENNYLNLKKGF